MIIRVRGPSGVTRFTVDEHDTVRDLFTKISEGLNLAGFSLIGPQKQSIQPSSKSLAQSGFRNGDMVIVKCGEGAVAAAAAAQTSKANIAAAAAESGFDVVDEVDRVLDRQDGLVVQKRDAQFCRHAEGQKCIHCVPLEPFDPKVMAEHDPPLKFFSFHTYLRKLNSGVDKGKFTALEDLRCKLAEGCSGHAPWPAGICTACQPSAVYLKRQEYRHVDYVQFRSRDILDNFINFWRQTQNQRYGIMFGTYEQYEQIPLGIQAVVHYIYEPPQESTPHGLSFESDPHFEQVKEMAEKALGIYPVGWVFTDLESLDSREGTVICNRYLSADGRSALITAEELLHAATFQSQYPNRVLRKYSPSGQFGSKFVTVVVSGDENNMISLKGYQISNQGMALGRDDCLLPVANAAGEMFVKESTNDQYVPDVFYTESDKYKNQVTKEAKPCFPVEYLIIDFPCGSAIEPDNGEGPVVPFPVSGRSEQSLKSLKHHLDMGDPMQQFKDFHLLWYLYSDSFFEMLKPTMPKLWKALSESNQELLHSWLAAGDWQTVQLLMTEI